MSHRQKVVGRTRRVEHVYRNRKAKVHTFSVETDVRVQTRISYGWRLACGHDMYGSKCKGKKAVDCHYCRWEAEGDPKYVAYAQANRAEGKDVTENAIELERTMAALPATLLPTDPEWQHKAAQRGEWCGVG